MKDKLENILITLLRLSLGFVFLWAFLDKTFGLGFATEHAKSWINGNSPTAGFLKFGATGDLFGEYFSKLSGNVLVDWMFMLGMLYVGFALISGITPKLGCYIGSLIMFLIYLSIFPGENNPVIDEHIIYILTLLVLSKREVHYFSLQKYWNNLSIVKRLNILKS